MLNHSVAKYTRKHLYHSKAVISIISQRSPCIECFGTLLVDNLFKGIAQEAYGIF